MLHKHIAIFTALLIGLFFLTVSCEDSLTSFDEQPPELPPASSMEMDFTDFDQEHSNEFSSMEMAAESESYSNFGNAAIRALFMKAVVNVNLAIPKALLKAAEHADPELNENEEWVWSYSKTADNKEFEVLLVASMETENEALWQLFVTNPELGLDNHLFFEGMTTPDGKSGTWTYYQLLGDEPGDAVSEVSWNVEDEDRRELRLEILSDRNGHMGDSIEYEFDAPVKRATYYNAEQDETTEIVWNTETREGYLMAPDYNEGEQACWDSGLANIPCS